MSASPALPSPAGPELTPWETWEYRRLTSKSADTDMADLGPLVHFTSRGDREFSFQVVPDCGAIPSMSIFAAAVLAFPTALWGRAIGIVIGLPLLYMVNIGRLTFLAFIGAWTNHGELFTFFHEYVWQAVFIIFVVAVWLVWVETLVRWRPQ